MNAEDAEVRAALVPAAAKKRRREQFNDQLPPAIALPSTNPDTTTQPSNQHPTPRRIETVVFSGYEIQTWYSSPYPAEESTSAPLSTHPDKPHPAKSSSLRNSVPSPLALLDPLSQPKSINFTPGEHKKVVPIAPVRKTDAQTGVSTQRLFVCDGCFKYMVQPAALTAHKKTCPFKHPPGKKVYQRGAHIIWEVDGAESKLYCQNLCLFGKLFIDHKYVFFDVEGFKFYVLTDALPSFDFVIGFFSKEKVSYDEYNLACIVTFPPYQKKGYGTLLIEFSYELSRRSNSILAGTPERPLSDLGLKGYLAFWTSVLIRHFRAVFQAQGEPPSIEELAVINSDRSEKSRKKWRGWEGGPSDSPAEKASSASAKGKRVERGKIASPAKGDEVVERPLPPEFSFPTSLEELARATNLRLDDVAFALVGSGLAQWRQKVVVVDPTAVRLRGGVAGEEGEHEEEEELALVITPELVEAVALAKKVKAPVLDYAFVLL